MFQYVTAMPTRTTYECSARSEATQLLREEGADYPRVKYEPTYKEKNIRKDFQTDS
jgi:hypothetical protein